MSDVFATSRATLEVVETGGSRLFVIELEFVGGGLVKVWEARDYVDAMNALREISRAAGVPWRDNYSRGRGCGTTKS